MGLSWAQVEPKWAQVGPTGPKWAQLGPKWGQAGPSGFKWAQSGPKWAHTVIGRVVEGMETADDIGDKPVQPLDPDPESTRIYSIRKLN